MGHRFLIRTPPHGILPGVVEILDSPVGVAPLYKMLGQLGRYIPCLRPIALRFPGADLQMPASLAAWRNPVIQDGTIQVMAERITRGHGPVWPCHQAAGLDELPMVGEHVQARLEVFRGLVDACRNRRGGEGCSGDTRRFQQSLVCRTDLLQLLLDDLAQALWYRASDRLNGLGEVPACGVLAQESLMEHLINEHDQKPWMATGALMQRVHQCVREPCHVQPLAEVGGHVSCRQSVEHQLRSLLMLDESRHHRAHWMRTDHGVHGSIGAQNQQPRRVTTAGYIGEPGQCRHVAPVEVFQHQHQRALRGQPVEGFRQLPQHPGRCGSARGALEHFPVYRRQQGGHLD